VEIEQFIYNKENYPSPINFEKDKINICYCGPPGIANGLNNIIKAIKIVNEMEDFNTSFNMNFIGNGPEKSKLISFAKNLNIKNIRFFDQVEKKYIPSILENSNFLIFNLMKLQVLNKGIRPNKLFDCMYSSKTIISSCNIEVDLVKKANYRYNITFTLDIPFLSICGFRIMRTL